MSLGQYDTMVADCNMVSYWGLQSGITRYRPDARGGERLDIGKGYCLEDEEGLATRISLLFFSFLFHVAVEKVGEKAAARGVAWKAAG
jgi:hypothetical protein